MTGPSAGGKVSLLGFCEWLAETPWSIALHESLYVYPVVETIHVLSLLLFVGSVIVVDLRLLGWTLREVPVSEVTTRILPWTFAGFVIAVVTGLLLFYAIPIRTYLSIFFRIKVLALIGSGINVLLLHRYMNRTRSAWDVGARPPLRARVAGAISLVSWAVVIAMGRMIAYNWFDCDRQPQSDFVNWAAGCVLE
ncbi:hypothetical protein MK489_02980 [Myxococcota bacterium]|nr:hypothetical protein [Myxococcota bacterium]